eukprot:s3101_g2.t1
MDIGVSTIQGGARFESRHAWLVTDSESHKADFAGTQISAAMAVDGSDLSWPSQHAWSSKKGVNLSSSLQSLTDMAITSSEYCLATQHAMFTLEDSSAELVLNWTQLIFQIGGWALTTAMSALFATVMVSTPKYTDPLGSHYLTQPESVIMVCGVLGFSASVSFMNVFDVVGDTILYCFALEEQRHKQQMAGKYDPYDEQSIFQRCICRSKNSDGFMSWLLGYEDEKADDFHHGHTQKVQYAPRSLLDAMEAAK